MQQQEYKIKSEYSQFIRELLSNCNNNIKMYNNVDKFKKEKHLIKLNINKNTQSNNMPSVTTLGVCWLIKNNSIFEFSTYYTYNTDNIKFNRSNTPIKKTVVTVHHLDLVDVQDFNNTNVFIDMKEMISYSTQKTLNFLHALFTVGFEIWIRKSDNNLH